MGGVFVWEKGCTPCAFLCVCLCDNVTATNLRALVALPLVGAMAR